MPSVSLFWSKSSLVFYVVFSCELHLFFYSETCSESFFLRHWTLKSFGPLFCKFHQFESLCYSLVIFFSFSNFSRKTTDRILYFSQCIRSGGTQSWNLKLDGTNFVTWLIWCPLIFWYSIGRQLETWNPAFHCPFSYYFFFKKNYLWIKRQSNNQSGRHRRERRCIFLFTLQVSEAARWTGWS